MTHLLFYGAFAVIIINGVLFSLGIAIAWAICFSFFVVLNTVDITMRELYRSISSIPAISLILDKDGSNPDEYGRIQWKESLWVGAVAITLLIETAGVVFYVYMLYRTFFRT